MNTRLIVSTLVLAITTGAITPLGYADNATVLLPGDRGRPRDGLPRPPGTPSQPPPPSSPLSRAPSMALALEAAQAVVAACKGYHVGVSIIDASGAPKLFYVADGTTGNHAYTGLRKAYTALTFNMPTSQVSELALKDNRVREKIVGDTNLLSFAGGLLLKAGPDVVGAIGVSGAEPSARNEECGLAGIARIQDRLK